MIAQGLKLIEVDMTQPITRLLIADDSPALRIGLRMIFTLDPTIEIVAETDNASDMYSIAFEKEPHVIVFDADMPDSEQSMREVLRVLPTCKMIALTMQMGSKVHANLVNQGAAACIELRASPLELLSAVQGARKILEEQGLLS
jgi:DNA-binding NarL/FixJ family response regulator